MASKNHTRSAHSGGRLGSPAHLRQFFFGVFVGAALALTSGCATVAPYEREYLSRPSMDFEREAHETKFRVHIRDAREAAAGGHGIAGGGCGCN